MSDLIPHRPQRGNVVLPPDMAVPRAVTFAEGRARVTYHHPRSVLWQDKPAIDLGLPVVATWTTGDGTWDLPPPDPGGTPDPVPAERSAA